MGCLLSHGCHYVDQMIWNFGDIAAATSVGSNTVRGPDLAREDTAAAVFRFKNGMLGNFICSWATYHTNLYIEFNVYGTEGFLHLTYDPTGARRLELYAKRQGATPAEVLYEHDPRRTDTTEGPKNFVGECGHFIDCIVHDREPLTNGREARKSMQALLAAYQGDDENRIIWLQPGERYSARPGTISTPRAGGEAYQSS
jgi:predicted dehydrogenase